MQRQLDHDGKLREFLTIKGQKRVMRDLEEKEMRKKEQEKEELEKQIKIFQETLDKIKSFCEEGDVEKIAVKYTKQEEENFALFNYVNELNHELEVLEESIEDIKTRISEQKEICEQKAKKEKNTLESLTKALEKATKIADNDEEILKKAEHELSEVLVGIRGIFESVGCDFTPILGLLG